MTTRASLTYALAALACLAPAAARAQGCVGAAVPEGGRAVMAVAAVSRYELAGEQEGTDLGVDYRANPAGPLGYGVGYALRSVGETGARMHVGSGDVSFRLPLRLPMGLAVCARAGAAVGRFTQSASGTGYTNYTLPLGAVVEFPLTVGPGTEVVPYVSPVYLYSRTEGNTFGAALTGEDDGLGVEAGVGFRWDRLVLTAGFQSADLSERLATPAYPRQRVFVKAGLGF